MTELLTLLCIIERWKACFPVDIERSKTVGHLKDAIKVECPVTLKDIAAKDLTLWRVEIPDEEKSFTVDNDNKIVKSADGSNYPISQLEVAAELSKVFDTELPQGIIQIFVQTSSDDRNTKRPRPDIPTDGPISWNSTFLMLQATKRRLFKEVYDYAEAGTSFVIQGPYQSGKTSLLWDIRERLEDKRDGSVVRFFDMSDIAVPLSTMNDVATISEAFAQLLSFRIFGQKLPYIEMICQLQDLPTKPHHYILVDEFQSIFTNPYLLRVARNFFRALSSKPAVSYVGVGTFQLRELMDGEDRMDSPFNKAIFNWMAPFDLTEMESLFKLYKKHCDPESLCPEVQAKIMYESGGHPASFMTLLKLTLQRRLDTNNWFNALERNIHDSLDGTHVNLVKNLKMMTTEQKALVRELTGNKLDVWESNRNDDLIRGLLNIGILSSSGVPNSAWKMNVRFTSGIILRICIDVLGP
ncbi:MAG: hypothetical protein J3Q66DRAFT_418650 [Benniella sp.]|nr:MAG: hypothetical protein J3Q66DRAFT_418650 [Benniella sp.]